MSMTMPLNQSPEQSAVIAFWSANLQQEVLVAMNQPPNAGAAAGWKSQVIEMTQLWGR